MENNAIIKGAELWGIGCEMVNAFGKFSHWEFDDSNIDIISDDCSVLTTCIPEDFGFIVSEVLISISSVFLYALGKLETSSEKLDSLDITSSDLNIRVTTLNKDGDISAKEWNIKSDLGC